MLDPKYWFNNSEITRDFPATYKAYAGYSRLMLERTSGFVRGGTFLFKLLRVLTDTLGLRSDAPIIIDGIKVYVDLCDFRMPKVIRELGTQSYEKRILKSLISSGDTFIDIGANHGSYSLIAATLIGENGFILAFEPQPKLAALIKRSFLANGFTKFRVYEIACGSQEGQVVFYVPLKNSGAASRFKSYSATSKHRKLIVKTARFDDIVESSSLPGRIFLKLDAEGSELSFLQGAERMIKRRKPTILLEINSNSAHAAGYSIQTLMDYIFELGYREFCELNDYPLTAQIRRMDDTRQRNILVLP